MESLKDRRIPTIVALGVTGSGKSTILNNLSGGTTQFFCDSNTESITDDYIKKEGYLNGNPKENLINFYDTIGFEDNRNIDYLIFTKIQKFLENLSTGIDVVLIVVSISSNLREIFHRSFRNTLDLLGENVIKKIKLLLTQINTLSPKDQEIFKQQHSPVKICQKLAERNIEFNPSNIIIYENTAEDTSNLITRIKDMIRYNDPVLPETSKLIVENLNQEIEIPNDYGIRDNTLFYVAAQKHEGLNSFTMDIFKKYRNINKEAQSILKKWANLPDIGK